MSRAEPERNLNGPRECLVGAMIAMIRRGVTHQADPSHSGHSGRPSRADPSRPT